MMIPQHSSKTWEHYTPRAVVEAAREVLGSIDLDPASCPEAQQVVRARHWFGVDDDGLAQRWRGQVFLNPPGGALRGPADAWISECFDTKSRAVAWWRRLASSFLEGDVTEAIFVGFSIEILQTAQSDEYPNPTDFLCCIPRQRLKFCGDQPTHANVIVYLGNRGEAFAAAFSPFGVIK